MYIISKKDTRILFALADVMIYVSHNRRGRHHNVGTCLWHVSKALILFAAKHAKGMSLRYGVIVFERLA